MLAKPAGAPPLVDLGVVLHRAGAERVQSEIDRGVPGGDPREVTHHIDLGQLRQRGQIVAQEACFEDRLGLRQRHVGFGIE